MSPQKRKHGFGLLFVVTALLAGALGYWAVSRYLGFADAPLAGLQAGDSVRFERGGGDIAGVDLVEDVERELVRLLGAGGAHDRQQLAEFHLSQVAHLARREVAEVQRAELPAHQLEHGVADLLQHPAHDAVASGVQGELHDGLAVVGGAEDARLVRGDRPVFEVNAGQMIDDVRAILTERGVGYRFVDFRRQEKEKE